MTNPDPTPESVAGTLAELRDFVDRETRQGSLSRSIGGAIISRIERIAATPQADRGDGLRETLDTPISDWNAGQWTMVRDYARAALRDTAPSGLDEPTLTRILGEVALVVGGDLLTGGVKHRVALASAILARLPESADQERTEG